MASSSPPRDAIQNRALPPRARSMDNSLSPSMTEALDFLQRVHDAGLGFAPLMPDPEALEAAARTAKITPKQALSAYLVILNYDE